MMVVDVKPPGDLRADVNILQALNRLCQREVGNPRIYFVIGGFMFSRRSYVLCLCSIRSCISSGYMTDKSIVVNLKSKERNITQVYLTVF